MSSVPHIGGVIVTSLNQIGDIAKGELRAWLEPWFETRGGAVTLGSGSNQAAAGDDPRLNAGVELAYGEFSADVPVSATSAATANTIVTAAAVSFDGSTPVWVQFEADRAEAPTTAGVPLILDLWDGSTDLGILGSVVGAASTAAPFNRGRRLTPSAGSHTFSVRGWVPSGTGAVVRAGAGGAGTNLPGHIRIVRV